MKFFTSDPAPCRKAAAEGQVVYENEYIRWTHDAASGQLTGAAVKNGSGENLLASPLRFQITCCKDGKSTVFAALNTADKVTFGENTVTVEGGFASADGTVLPGLRLRHVTEYGEWGDARHTLELFPEKPLSGVTALTPAAFGIAERIDILGIRRRICCGVGAWSQNPMQWQELHGGTRTGDVVPVLEGHLPLSLLMLQRGVEALQFELGEDIAAWEVCPDYQECAMVRKKDIAGYEVRMSSFIDRIDETLAKPLTFKFRFSLPFVRKNIVPLRRVSSLLYFERGFDKRWPTEADLEGMNKAGYDLLRLHCDGDSFKNGIYWRATIYPPFPEAEMKKMAEFLDAAHRHGLHVVPYFSVKEFHPDSPDYPANYLKWGRRALRSARVRTNGTFGSVMCLCTDWRKKRRDSIKEVLSKHPFDGIYYDWCAGLECDNEAHGAGPHWDNEELLEHIKWTVREFARTPERYLHVTYVASLAVENAATMIITEEQGFPDPGPEMFTPHVHFLNVAPRQICSMIRNATSVQLRQEAMAALLHHATVSSLAQPIVDFYASLDFLDEVSGYTRHTAPGEGLAFSSDPEVGVSVYWNDAKALIVAANFSETPKKAELRIALPDKPELEEEVSLGPLEVRTIRAELLVERL